MNPIVNVLPAGPTSETAQIMVAMAMKARLDYRVRQLAEEITKRIAARDQLSEVLALYHYCLRNFRYLSGTYRVELQVDPENLLAGSGQGDCNIVAVLLGALCMCVGRPVRFVTGGFSRYHNQHEHVWCEVMVYGRPVALDTVANVNTPNMLRQVTSATAFYA